MKLSHTRLVVVVDNVRSAFNVGSIFRTCDAVGVDTLYLCGFSAIPPHPKVLKTSLGSEVHVPWEHHCQTSRCIYYLQQQGFEIVVVENVPQSPTLYQLPSHPRTALVLGHEKRGVSTEVQQMADKIVRIPQLGVKESLNVAVACGVVLYEYTKKRFAQERKEFI